MNKHEFFCLILGAWLGVVGMALFVRFGPSDFRVASDLLTECEKSLPRDQRCGLVAVPEGLK